MRLHFGLACGLLVASSITMPVAGQTQERSRTAPSRRLVKDPTLISVSGKNATKKGPATATRQPAPAPLDWSLIRATVKESAGKDVKASKDYALVTSQAPYHADRAFVSLMGQVFYTPQPGGMDQVLVGPSGAGNGQIDLDFKPTAAGVAYLLDVSLSVAPGSTLEYRLPDGSTKSETFPAGGPQHVLFMVTSTNTEWQTTVILVPKQVWFHSFKVTTLQ